MENKIQKVASLILFFGIFLVATIQLGFLFGLAIHKFTLPVIYSIYVLIVYYFFKSKDILKYMILYIPLLCIVLMGLYSKTYDFTFDGQTYHQTAVISLAQGWNPILEANPEINAPVGTWGEEGNFGLQFAIGYPKTLWIIQASIYAMTGYINTGAITNILVVILAAIFLYYFLIELQFKKRISFFITSLIIATPHTAQQLFSFMADNFSYQISIIATIALIQFARKKDIQMSAAIFFSSWILFIGTKFNNAYLGLVYISIFIFILIQHSKIQSLEIKKLRPIVIVGIIFTLITVSNPFITNLIRYKSPIYPANLPWAQREIVIQNIPENLHNSNKFTLLLYGIYGQAHEFNQIAHLKTPFTTNKYELYLYLFNTPSHKIGTNGIFFSGLFTLSILILLFLFCTVYKENKTIVKISIVIIVIFICCALLLPSPNIMRYTPQLYLIPIITLICMLKSLKDLKSISFKIAIILFTVGITMNATISLAGSFVQTKEKTLETKKVLTNMKKSGKTFYVYAPIFFSHYARIQESGITFNKTDSQTCMYLGRNNNLISTSGAIMCGDNFILPQ